MKKDTMMKSLFVLFAIFMHYPPVDGMKEQSHQTKRPRSNSNPYSSFLYSTIDSSIRAILMTNNRNKNDTVETNKKFERQSCDIDSDECDENSLCIDGFCVNNSCILDTVSACEFDEECSLYHFCTSSGFCVPYRPDTCQDDDGVEETEEAEEVCSTYYTCSEEDCVPI